MAIVVADDDAPVREIVWRFLYRLGFDCICVTGAADLMRVCRKRRPRLVISDVSMPDGDGIQSCLELRRLYPNLPVIIITGDPSHAERARNAGFRRILLKPFEW